MDNNGILIIYTGGTIGMSKIDRDINTLINKDEIIESILEKVKLNNKDKVVTIRSIIDSSQLDYQIFNEISSILKMEYDNYSGFIIISGTDTMAYLQSLLKWQIIGLEKPIILTGAINSYDQDRKEGVNNINYGIEQVGIYKNQGIVGIAMNYKLIKNPTTKTNSTSKSPYKEIINSDLEKLRLEIFNNSDELKFNIFNDLKLESIYINPFMYINDTKSLADGLIIIAYGQGTFKEDILLKKKAKRYSDQKKPIIVISQCTNNNLNVKQYQSGSFLEKYEVLYCSGSCIEEGIAFLTYLINSNILLSEFI